MASSRKPQSRLSKDEFGQTVAARIKKAGEPGDVTYVSDNFRVDIKDEGELVQQFNLENVYKEYCARRAEERETMLSRIVQTALVRHKPPPEPREDRSDPICRRSASESACARSGRCWLTGSSV